METRCWYCDVTELAEPERFARGLAALPWPDRREKVLRFRREKDRLLCLGAGLLCAQALRQAGADDLSLTRSPLGKPALLRRGDLHFSLSHSGTLALCAVSGQPVGADVEGLRPPDQGVARLTFQPRELAWLAAQPDQARAFTRLWTRKESLLKRLGDGFSRDPRSVSVLPGTPSAEGGFFGEWERAEHLLCVSLPAPAPVKLLPWRVEV